MITSILSLSAKADQAEPLEDLYARHGVLDRARRAPGCRSAVLLRASAPEAGAAVTHVVIAEWDNADAYAGWVADPWRAKVTEELTALLDGTLAASVVAGLYEPVVDRPFDGPTIQENP